MKFSELYKANKAAVKSTLTAMWCSNSRDDAQRDYAKQIGQLIDTELFASENYVPLVQCMDRYESVKSVSREEAEKLVGGLWKKDYPPYEHQYQAWKALSNTEGEKQSMVVTTGTGSGKTECFMLPLVNDLLMNPHANQIEAIFLYPLNALMEDQKDRLQGLLEDTNLKFAVYNGNLPEDDDQNYIKQHERIEQERSDYHNIIPTREEMRKTPPNIVLTNPTMLEYMLLRNKDQKLFTEGSLKWIVIDETHTFSGAGAAELAMLIRRLLIAFGVEAKNVRFATSSATIGNAKNEAEKNENDEKLREFISQLSGVQKEQIKLITGNRIPPTSESSDAEKERCRELLSTNDYVHLDDLFTEGSIEEKLKRLDDMCDGDAPLKAKVHFFYRVPNNGLRVQLNDWKDGTFRVKSFMSLDNKNNAPYLELFRCNHCGGYLAVGESVENKADKYQALTKADKDMFSFDTDNTSGKNKLIFSLTQNGHQQIEGNSLISVEDDIWENDYNGATQGIVMNVKGRCPHCAKKVIGKEGENIDDENTMTDEMTNNAQEFRLPADFISRMLAPSILPQLRTTERKPHDGQQYISFVDSRQAAARSTLKQNIEEERMWLYSRLFNELTKRTKNAQEEEEGNNSKIERYKNKLARAIQDGDEDDIHLYNEELAKLKSRKSQNVYMSWKEVYDYLKRLPEFEALCYQSINKSENSDEVNQQDEIEERVKRKYLYSLMIEQLGKRPRQAAAPETMGLFTTYYPKLEGIIGLPTAVINFNELLKEQKIDVQEWKNLLKIFLDYTVRSNQSIFIMDQYNLDIEACQRFGTVKSPRRPVHEPKIESAQSGSISAIALLLSKLIEPDGEVRSVARENRDIINKVLKAMWNDLTETTQLIQFSQRYSDDRWRYDTDGDNQTYQSRLNVVDIAFKLYDKACLCDARFRGEKYETLRPVDTLFMGYSPYVVEGEPVKPKNELTTWNLFDKEPIDSGQISIDEIHKWAKTERKMLWENSIWGDNGSFTNRLDAIYQYPNIFIQAEHTAQVAKLVSKQSQEMFKNQEINILACSTTMEMGVDLGNLELVMMASIPPQPSNYKQRAGRSGRNDASRSACITLCGSDAVGLRTLYNPMNQLITRPMAVPSVDLNSPQVIQRHVNAFLFRSSGIFSDNAGGNDNNLGQEVIELFTHYRFWKEVKPAKKYSIIDLKGIPVYPNSRLGDKDDTKYSRFLCYLNNQAINNDKLEPLLSDTCFDKEGIYPSILRCKQDIERCYDELLILVDGIAETYEEECKRLSESPKQEDRNKVKGNIVDSSYGYYLRHKYSEILSKSIISYFATNRFTPNANMPVDVVEFNKDLKYESENRFDRKKSDNPSYPLQAAIAQYAPGNTVVLENRSYIVRGILYTDMYRSTNTFKQIYSDGNITVIDDSRRIRGNEKEWFVNEKIGLTLIEPVAFIPDVNEYPSRTMEKAPYIQVSAQLIGAGDWAEFNDGLIMMRSNRDCGEAKILYYNEGRGYGYAVCTKCGKAVLETLQANKYGLPGDMNNQKKTDNNGTPRWFHYKINRLERNNRDKECGTDLRKIQRNVILGGLIQTDYCEIKVRLNKQSGWLSQKTGNENLLTTLGILITEGFVNYIGKDSKDVDFAIMPNGHLCIFDVNPGGSGYANQLANQYIMKDVLAICSEMLSKATSKDALLDKYTIRYLDKLDVEGATRWIEDVLYALNTVPEDIARKYPNASVAKIQNIFDDFKSAVANDTKALFVTNEWDKWLYQSDADSIYRAGWKQRIQEVRSLDKHPEVCVVDSKDIPTPVYDIMKGISDWATILSTNNPLPEGLLPLALVKGSFYFTNQAFASTLNADWAMTNVYRVPAANIPTFDMRAIDLDIKEKTQKFTLDLSSDTNVNSKDLGGVIAKRIPNLMSQFKEHCGQHPNDKLIITYQDEHLKSVLSMVVTMQFVEYFVKAFGRSYSIKFINEIYTESKESKTVSANIENDIDRNEILRDLAGKWIGDIAIKGGLLLIDTRNARTLPHWRELKFECAGKALILYPNGGIINEWFLDGRNATKQYGNENTNTSDNIPLYRKKEIMYDAEIKDIEV
jgi:hypothetical protein